MLIDLIPKVRKADMADLGRIKLTKLEDPEAYVDQADSRNPRRPFLNTSWMKLMTDQPLPIYPG